MTLDPQAQTLLEKLAEIRMQPLHELSVAEARRTSQAMADMQGPTEAVARVEDRTVPGPGGGIPIRIYTPFGAAPFPVLIYFHGGGWVLGDIASSDGLCRILTNAAGCIVISVDYRLAPEHPFPAAADDSYSATQWIAAHAAEFSGDPSRIAVSGDSAGGNLVAVVSQMARDQGTPAIHFQLLIYLVTDADFNTLSYNNNADDYFLTRDAMRWFWNHYVPLEADRANSKASPLRAASFAGLPPALVITAEYDPLRDEGEQYAECLRAAGVPVQLTRYDGMIHGFFTMSNLLDQGKAAIRQAAEVLRTAFQQS